jgi:biotin carboxyl carrier protein
MQLVVMLVLLGHKTTDYQRADNQVCCVDVQQDHHGGERMGEIRKVIVDGVEFEVDIEVEDDSFKATVGGQTFKISIPNAVSASPKRKRDSSRGKKSGVISANIPGKIVTIDVAVGDVVEEGHVILILEAMKMQNEITAPIAGMVESINCVEGQSIEANIPLAVIKGPDDSSQDEG